MGEGKKSAVILMNLGTPERPDRQSVARFLGEFLADPRVVEAPRFVWLPILKGVVIPRRAARVAKLYQSIWREQGSPIRAITEQQVAALQQRLQNEYGAAAPQVAYAMTYGQPSLSNVVEEMTARGVEEIVLLPLYPQYSGSTTGAVYDQVADIYRRSRNVPNLQVVKDYHTHRLYIDALVASITRHWQCHGRNTRLLFSFHGVPQSYVDAGDPYYDQCHATATAVAAALGLKESQWGVGFQSRFGPKKWIQPYADELLLSWLADGIDSVDIISPAFSADCLETLEELQVELRDECIAAGGREYSCIACLNSNDEHIEMMAEIVMGKISID